MKKAAGRPGPGGTRIHPRKPRGRARGVPATEAEANAARVAALKHGGYAKATSVKEARAIAVDRRFGPGSSEILEAYHDAISNGELMATDFLAERGLAELELIRRDVSKNVARQGAVLKESIVSPATGEILGERIKLHPGVEGVVKLSEVLGFTSAARRLDPKARGEGARDEAMAAMLRRNALLAESPQKDALPPPEDDVLESEVVR